MATQDDLARLKQLEEGQALTGRNRNLQRRYLEELYVHKNFDNIEEAVSPEFRGWMYPEGEKGFGLVKQAWKQVWHGSPNVELVIDEAFAEGDLTCCILRSFGTHLGEFNGMPATGERVECKIVDTNRIDEKGQLIEAWPMPDTLGLMQQLGFAEMQVNPIGLQTGYETDATPG